MTLDRSSSLSRSGLLRPDLLGEEPLPGDRQGRAGLGPEDRRPRVRRGDREAGQGGEAVAQRVEPAVVVGLQLGGCPGRPGRGPRSGGPGRASGPGRLGRRASGGRGARRRRRRGRRAGRGRARRPPVGDVGAGPEGRQQRLAVAERPGELDALDPVVADGSARSAGRGPRGQRPRASGRAGESGCGAARRRRPRRRARAGRGRGCSRPRRRGRRPASGVERGGGGRPEALLGLGERPIEPRRAVAVQAVGAGASASGP